MLLNKKIPSDLMRKKEEEGAEASIIFDRIQTNSHSNSECSMNTALRSGSHYSRGMMQSSLWLKVAIRLQMGAGPRLHEGRTCHLPPS